MLGRKRLIKCVLTCITNTLYIYYQRVILSYLLQRNVGPLRGVSARIGVEGAPAFKPGVKGAKFAF